MPGTLFFLYLPFPFPQCLASYHYALLVVEHHRIGVHPSIYFYPPSHPPSPFHVRNPTFVPGGSIYSHWSPFCPLFPLGTPGDWYTTLNLKDAYFHLSVYQGHRKFLRFVMKHLITSSRCFYSAYLQLLECSQNVWPW